MVPATTSARDTISDYVLHVLHHVTRKALKLSQDFLEQSLLELKLN